VTAPASALRLPKNPGKSKGLMMSTINNSILRHHLFAPSPILVATTQTQQLHIRRIFQHVTRCTFIFFVLAIRQRRLTVNDSKLQSTTPAFFHNGPSTACVPNSPSRPC
jgi:hypothetical protein